jgi:hypothetical protein
MPRFTISRHTGAKEGDHFDLMLERGEALKTWRLQTTAFQTAQTARQIKDHRKTYLEYEGEIAGKRGRVELWDTGTYSEEEWQDDRIRVALSGRQTRLRLILVRAPGQAGDGETLWTVSDAAQEVRKHAAALLRGSSLEDAPTAELSGLRAGLAQEEHKLMGLVDLYTRGAAVEWAQATLDPGLRKRIESEKARWQHPWLAAAKAYADQLAELAQLLRQQRPGESRK